jgi:arginine decarboxylase
MPGERFGKKKESPQIQFLLSLQEFSRRFPGFGHEIHGIEVDKRGVFWMRCVIEDGIIQEKKETCDKEEKSTFATTPVSRPSAHPRSAMKSFKKGRS